MAKYEKWLGAGIGWLLTGNPLGGFLGFVAGTFVEPSQKTNEADTLNGVSEFEANLMVLASHLIKIDGPANHAEIDFTENFLNTYFTPQFSGERRRIFHHCLQKEYDLNNVCTELRRYTQPGTRTQVLRFMFDLALSDGELNERENYFIFKIAGFLNINDSDFMKLRDEHQVQHTSAYDVLGVNSSMSFAEIRSVYRRLVLKYHPDRNKDAGEVEKKNLTKKFLLIQEAYTKIRAEKEEK